MVLYTVFLDFILEGEAYQVEWQVHGGEYRRGLHSVYMTDNVIVKPNQLMNPDLKVCDISFNGSFKVLMKGLNYCVDEQLDDCKEQLLGSAVSKVYEMDLSWKSIMLKNQRRFKDRQEYCITKGIRE